MHTHRFFSKVLHLIIYIAIFSLYGVASACKVRAQSSLMIMSFNCENAFDTLHDKGKKDYEYVSGGTRRWNIGRLYRKLDGIARIIAATDTINQPGIVVLCEVENDSVLKYLTRRTSLRALGYDYVMTESPDQRGIDVALLYSRFQFMPIRVESVRPQHVGSPTRDILHVTGIAGGDTLDVYAVHLPSKLGGKEGVRKSMQVAQGLKANVDSVLAVRPNGRVVIVGDFNTEFDSPLFTKVFKAGKYWTSLSKVRDSLSLKGDSPSSKIGSSLLRSGSLLYDVIVEKVPPHMGTYKYKANWSVIDHILVNGNVDVVDAGVLNSPFLLENDDLYGGVKPRRTYIGYKYNGGISDHLPVWVRIDK